MQREGTVGWVKDRLAHEYHSDGCIQDGFDGGRRENNLDI